MPLQRKHLIIVTFLTIAAGILAGCGADTAFIDFPQFARRSTPNDALACPAGFCAAKIDLITAPIAMSVEALADQVRKLPLIEPRTTVVRSDDLEHRYVLVQRSAVFRFPDTVNIAITQVDAGHAVIAIYSRSNYGHGDFGVNLARVKRWLDLLGVKWHAA